MSDIYVSKISGLVVIDGERYNLKRGRTRVRAGHPLLNGRGDAFEVISVDYDVETARTEPKPGKKPSPKTRRKGREVEAKSEQGTDADG